MKKLIILLILLILPGCALFDPHKKDYGEAAGLYAAGEYEAAAAIFAALGEYGYSDSREMELQSLAEHKKISDGLAYTEAIGLMIGREFESSMELFESIRGYNDSEDYIATVKYLWAASMMGESPETAVDMVISIKDYNEYIAKYAYGTLYDKITEYMSDGFYYKALPILENIPDYKDSAELYELCGRHIKYNNAVAEFDSTGHSDSFSELGTFLDSADYIAYMEAGKQAEAQACGEAAKAYKSLGEFLDSAELYEKYEYIYLEEQFRLGNNLPVPEEYESEWRAKRMNDLDKSKIGAVEVTGIGLYIGDGFTKYGTQALIDRIYSDIPVFFIADSPEKVRYTVDISGRAKYYGAYDDGSGAYETTVTVIIRDVFAGRSLFAANYTAYPPEEGYLPDGDVYAEYDFLEPSADGPSVYEKDILPVLKKLFE